MQKTYTACIRFLQISSLILFGILAAAAFFRTAYVENAYEIVIELGWDNPFLNLLFLCCFLLILTGIGNLFLRAERGHFILLVLTCLWVFGASLLWTYLSKSGPASDCGSVYYAAKRFAVNDFSAVSYRDSYFSVYPFQLGLAFFYELIFRFARSDNFHILQGVNALCLVVCTISQYHLCGRFFRERAAQVYTLLLTASCLPLIMYGSYIYGEVPSFAFLLFGTWMLLFFLEGPVQIARETNCPPMDEIPACRAETASADTPAAAPVKSCPPQNAGSRTAGTSSRRSADRFFPLKARRALASVLALFSLPCSVLVRKNSLVFMIALGIILILWLIRNRTVFPLKKSSYYLAYFILLSALSISVIPMVQTLYARRSGQQINPGIPSSTYLAMGLMETEAGPGHYSGYNFETFTAEADYNAEAASLIGWDDYRERLSYFFTHPDYALQFLGRKFCVQWLNTGWSIFDSTYVAFGERLPVIESCFSGPLYRLLKDYMTNYQMTLYLLAALCCFALLREKKDTDVFVYLFPLTAFGGALLFLAWEASGRYVLPYAIFMLPCAGYGMRRLTSRIIRPSSRNKKSGSPDSRAEVRLPQPYSFARSAHPRRAFLSH